VSEDDLQPDLRNTISQKIKEYENRVSDIELGLLGNTVTVLPPPEVGRSSPERQYSPFDLEFYDPKLPVVPLQGSQGTNSAGSRTETPRETVDDSDIDQIGDEKVTVKPSRRGETSLEMALSLANKAKKKR